jgi:hypothetical protein
MINIVRKYHPLSDLYFKTKSEASFIAGSNGVGVDTPIAGIHIFNWSPSSYITLEINGSQIVTFPPTSLVEGAIYFMNVTKIINAGPNENETQVMGVSF